MVLRGNCVPEESSQEREHIERNVKSKCEWDTLRHIYVEEIQLSQYGIITWGKTIREYCAGKMIATTDLHRGVYFIEVQFGCTVPGIRWSLVGHMQGIEQIAIASLQVLDLPPFELPSYICDQDSQNIMEDVAPVLETPERMITIPLRPLQLPDKAFMTVKAIDTSRHVKGTK
jgi:hypothetical protein